ncbi:MAG TPA: GH92 family glycosyl hydrolase [Chitinophaga sp.]|uniref:GH92 family glycosyl hydrolase n=1 Tax=Chitinophaga sp. TaxID=1869181 RepID=UPI002F93887E
MNIRLYASIMFLFCFAPCFAQKNIEYVDPTIGNVAPLLNPNRPVVHLPNQMVRVFPNRKDHLDDQITDFPLLAQNVITPQMVFSVKPTDTVFKGRLTFDYDHEITHPWYYSTQLTEPDVQVAYTAGERTGIYRFTFPKGVQKHLLLSHYYPKGEYTFDGPDAVAGTEYVNDANHKQKGVAYMYGVFSGKPQSGITTGEKHWTGYTVTGIPPKLTEANGIKAWVSYPVSDTATTVEFRYAISFISREQAKKNLEAELKGVTFDVLKNRGQAAWAKALGQIEVEGGTLAQRRSFYTALYRCYVRMVNITEQGKYFSGYDNQVHEDKQPFYTDDYAWGNYLALHPLRCILDPELEGVMLQSFVNMYTQSGLMPEYPKLYGDRPGMFGFHSSVIFLDAYRKGVRNFDTKKALEGMLKSEDKYTLLPGRKDRKGALDSFYDAKGYYPALHPGEAETDPLVLLRPGQKRSSVAITLANSYDSWALSEFAKELGDTATSSRYAARKYNYKNLWSEQAGMFMPKDAKGEWINIDPKIDGGHAGLDYYNENNGWTYMWNVQQDLPGLRMLMGGSQKMEQRMDQLFHEGLDRSKYDFWDKYPDATGMTGQFSMGNQPTFFIPYIFNYTSSPWKTQKWTRFILDTWFKDDIFGVPGDEDAGSMSAVVVFSAMGFFPITPGLPEYTITSPVFSKVIIHLHNGKKFTVIARNSSRVNKYIQSASLNGKALPGPWFSHQELMNGGTLILEMGEKPGKIGAGR